ncbi:MAG: O-antigen ligase, partial [Algoriphagus sp.]
HEMISVFYASIIIVFLITLQKVFIGSQYGALVDFIFLITPVVHLSLLDSKGWRTKDYLNIAILTIGSLSLLISDSRRVLMSIVIVWFSGLKMKQFINLALILLLPAFLVIGALDIGVKFRYGKSVEQLSDVFNSEQTGNEDVLRSLTTGRSILWEAGINMIIDNPIFGVGLENHVNLLPEYGGYTKIRIHNIFLDVTSQAGLLGLVVFLAILSNQLKELRKLRRSLFLRGFNYHQTLVYSLYISFIAVIVFSFFGGSMLLGKWGWFQVGFLSSVMVVLQKELK